MKILWITQLPEQVQQEALGGQDHGAQHSATWITAHLPPPPGIELHLASLWPGGSASKAVVFKGATFHLIPCPRHGRSASFFLFDIFLYRPLYRMLRPDIVHGWGTEDSNGLVAVLLAPESHVVGIQGVMNVINARSKPTLRDRLAAGMEGVTFALARHVVAESAFAADAGRRLCRRTIPVVVPQPVRTEVLAMAPGDKTQKQAVFIGRITTQKGIADAVEAFSRAAPDSWTLKIIGGGTARERENLGAMLAAFRLTNRAVYIECLAGNEIARVLQAASMLILPTRIDSGPTVLKEALCMGVWPVCYDNTGPGELIRAFQYGILARDQDKDHLVECLEDSFARAPWEDSKHRQICVESSRRAFAREKAWRELACLYEKIAMGLPSRG